MARKRRSGGSPGSTERVLGGTLGVGKLGDRTERGFDISLYGRDDMFIICGGGGGNPAKRKSLKYRRGSTY